MVVYFDSIKKTLPRTAAFEIIWEQKQSFRGVIKNENRQFSCEFCEILKNILKASWWVFILQMLSLETVRIVEKKKILDGALF